jgi:hypothetical protein
MAKDVKYNVGDLVELKTQIRKPRLRGIIIESLGYNENLGDHVYLIFCFSFKPPRKLKWGERSIRKIS